MQIKLNEAKLDKALAISKNDKISVHSFIEKLIPVLAPELDRFESENEVKILRSLFVESEFGFSQFWSNVVNYDIPVSTNKHKLKQNSELILNAILDSEQYEIAFSYFSATQISQNPEIKLYNKYIMIMFEIESILRRIRSFPDIKTFHIKSLLQVLKAHTYPAAKKCIAQTHGIDLQKSIILILLKNTVVSKLFEMELIT